MDAVYGHKLHLANENHAWLCLDLLDVLCQLAERGHTIFVRSMLDYPLKHCPEVLLLGMAHVNVNVHNLNMFSCCLMFLFCIFNFWLINLVSMLADCL